MIDNRLRRLHPHLAAATRTRLALPTPRRVRGLGGSGRSLALRVLILAAAALALPGCSKQPDTAKLKGDNVLFITLDTTRADRIGCYGYTKAQTPALDALAARGTLFEQAFSQAPLTCPSHCSMMTGLYPREHGVRDNGMEMLGEQATLAKLFKQNGYRTGAFVAAFVLDDQFGIGQGFDEYNDDMGGRKGGVNPLEAQIPGDLVTDRALKWLKSSKDKPFFCWVHYYDPHDPYAPPAEFAAPDRLPYDGEISFMDSQIKRLIDWLAAEGLLEDTLIVAVGDHGESFDEHGEQGHTNFTYETNLQVPLIFAHPHSIPAGKRVGTLVEVVDLYPTMLELFGWKAPRALLSRSLAGALRGDRLEDRDVYSETLYVLHNYEWAEQRSLTTRRWKYISSTKPELYDRTSDPGETKNLALDEPRISSDMYDLLHSRWESMVPGTAERADLPPEAVAKLQDLGYLGGKASDPQAEQFLTPGLPDPKDNIAVVKMSMFGRILLKKARTKDQRQSVATYFREVAQMAPKSASIQFMYAQALFNVKEFEAAIEVVDRMVRELGAQKAPVYRLKGDALQQLGRLDEAIRDYKAALATDEESATTHESYAAALAGLGKMDEALQHARRAIALDPTSPAAHARLCSLLTDKVELAKAVDELAKVLGDSQEDPRVRLQFAQSLVLLDRKQEAAAELERLIKEDPESHPWHMALLGGLYLDLKEYAAARRVYQAVAMMEDHQAQGLYHVGLAWAHEGREDEAVKMYEQALQKDPAYPEAMMELTRAYRRQGRLADSARVLASAVEAAPDSSLALSALGQILATTANEKLRDCPKAIQLLEKASQLAGGRDALILANLAAAYAGVGRYDLAVETVKKALELGDPAQQERLQQQLQLHENGQRFIDERLK